MRDVRGANPTKTTGSSPVEETLLLEDLCGVGAETPRHGHASLRSGLEERQGASEAARQGVSVVRETSEQNGHALHVHHLKPFRFGGTNSLKNLVALCEECHHRIEKVTDQVLASIMIDVRLVKSSLIIKVDGRQRWPMSALGAASPPTGTVPSGRDF